MERSLELEIKADATAPADRLHHAARTGRRPTLSASSRVNELFIRLAFAVVSIGVPLLIWYLGTRYRIEFYVRFQSIPTPLEVFHTAVRAVGSDSFATNIAHSLQRIFLGFLIALVTGVAMGLLIGRYRVVNQLLMPAIEVLRPIPAIAWVPLSIMLWPTTESSIVFITFIGALYPILLNTVDGVQSLDGVLLRAGRCLGASEAQLFWHVILPGVLPNIFTGLAVGMGVAWVSLIAAEMISGQYGVGYYTWEAYSLVNYPAIVLGMITIGALGLLCSGAIRVVGRLSMPWLAYVNGARK